MPPFAIGDLALLGDRRTAALVTRAGNVVWYCPGRFDAPALLGALLDEEQGGLWALELSGAEFASRTYLEDSGVLETRLNASGGELRVTDFMPLGQGTPPALCRLFSGTPGELRLILTPRPDYARRSPELRAERSCVVVDGRHFLYASHPLKIAGEEVSFTVPAGERGWAVLADAPLPDPQEADLLAWQEATLHEWRRVARHASYHGPYQREVRASLRALRLLTYGETGGVIAAPTTSLPEVLGGTSNWDYRYVWLRDAGMIVSALTRAGSDGTEERRFLKFICGWMPQQDGLWLPREDGLPLAPCSSVTGEPVPAEETLPLAGYRGSAPVRIGNGARAQRQLDAYANVLLAAKVIYGRFGTREHWSVVERVAEYLAATWREPDYGIWEERTPRQHVSGKVISAVALEYIAEHADHQEQAARWRAAARDMRAWVSRYGLTSEGAYAAVAGEEGVDVTAALYPVWGYCAPDTPEMLATIALLERDHCENHLYRRTLQDAQGQEGAFLAATCWVAQYWVMRDVERAHAILEAVLACASDLGLLPEEADPMTASALGNLPQSFVHASLIGAVIDLKAALSG